MYVYFEAYMLMFLYVHMLYW